MKIYRLVSLVEGVWIKEDFIDANVIPAMSARGYEFTGICTRKQLRPELRYAPMFSGVCGPAWGGDEIGGPVIRYETTKAYAALST